MAKLCDFGLSKTTSGSSLNSCVGSLNWCAPEVLLRNAPFTKYADVYSMGMVLLELYTHSPPFAGMQPLQIVKAIDSGTSLPVRPRARVRLYVACVRVLIWTCCCAMCTDPTGLPACLRTADSAMLGRRAEEPTEFRCPGEGAQRHITAIFPEQQVMK